jgi:glycosyltransferase involved in cell wall biosynthesis
MADVMIPVYILFFIICILLLLLSVKPSRTSLPLFPYSLVSSQFNSKPVAPEDMKTITWIIHAYPPTHNAGSEWMAHAMNRYLIEKKGYKVNVILPDFPRKEFEGVNIILFEQQGKVEYAIRHSALILSHHTYTAHAVLTGAVAKRPVLLLMHDHNQEKMVEVCRSLIARENLYLVNNSRWLQKHYNNMDLNSFVIYPPVYWKEYRVQMTEKNKYVTLINLNSNKGGNVLIQIAKRMPDVQFLGVEGSYNSQIKNTNIQNIRYMKNTPKIQEIYSMTKILLMPSREESWGRVALEAMSSGIPVIANPTPGLREACGDAGLFADRDNVSEWVKIIRELLSSQSYYKKIGDASFARAKAVDPQPQLQSFSMWIEEIKWQDKTAQLNF